jgi:glycosyltransferase involved in cell wall biosynthesis
MNDPLVSVVVPTRNRADLLVQNLEALAAQTYRNLEVLVIDDASTDETPEVLAHFAKAHPDLALTVLRNSPQRGANPSRNRGIKASRGSLVAFEDDDCIAEHDWIEKLVRQFVSPQVGAVTGLVEDPEPRNIYDLGFRGTHRVYGETHATRLVACNMCVRRELLEGKLDEDRAEVSADMSVSGRGDEEDLYLKLRAGGYEVRIAHDAKVLHVHYYSRSSFFRQAWKGGRATAKLGYKYHLKPRYELLCLAAGDALLLGSAVNPLLLVPAAGSFGAFTAGALVYNEIWRKKKTPLQALKIAPVMTAYYQVRTAGYVVQTARLWLGVERMERFRLSKPARG